VGLHLVIGLFLSGLIGLSLGLIGGGGSIITVPVLVYVMGVEPHEAVGMSLAVVGATSLVASLLHYRSMILDIRVGLLFGGAGVVGAIVGSPLTVLLTPAALLLVFAALMVLIAVLMLRRKTAAASPSDEPTPINVRNSLLAGFGVGVLTGFLGVGGGFLIVPALMMFGGLNMKEAIGTSLFVIFLNCVAGLIGHATQNNFDWGLTTLITSLAIAGAGAGTFLSHRVAPQKLQKGFAVVVLLVAVFLVTKNYSVLMGA
jgi:uncharacterized membrane protein YfcA